MKSKHKKVMKCIRKEYNYKKWRKLRSDEKQLKKELCDPRETWDLRMSLLAWVYPRIYFLLKHTPIDYGEETKKDMKNILEWAGNCLLFRWNDKTSAEKQEVLMKNAKKAIELVAKNFRTLWW